MNIRERGDAFGLLVGLELKGRIMSRGFYAKDVAAGIGRPQATFNRWINGNIEIPVSVMCAACEFIGVDPTQIVEDAYARLAEEYGEYSTDDANVGGVHEDDYEVTPGGPQKADLALAANKRRKKVDIPHAE